MSEPLFFASYLKLERAEKFISELKEEIEAYRQSKPFSASYNMSADPPHVNVAFAAIPRIHSAILGDAVHNLRTALDLMACELVRLQGCSDKDVYFPFSNGAEELEGAIKKGFHRAGEDAVALLRSFRPYKGGDRMLRAIHDLDIQDKHRALILTGRRMNIRLEGTYSLTDPNVNSLAVEGDVDLVFPEFSPLAGEDVIRTLEQSMQIVVDIIEAFSKLVASRQ